MKLDRVCRVGKGARAPVVRVTCKLDCARRAGAPQKMLRIFWGPRPRGRLPMVGTARKARLCPPYDSLRAERAVDRLFLAF